ncbi:hypothetical protein L202_01014 [Cryptococcus amylolentus CBS 6039]|uniref:Uncharacterized protein n=1 Tax=Cryptococcus amylolentus CBS 6039 TaxID=1295533 RepID=A0A1E3I253_9TREE|nr:hypothetical protein L202_01014 [Cryptococcus amylolentus CBS 6039]ODN82730.1 hypothetical protein L202_01014 [Cryptococcus amylolentus CBS 6039]
MSSSSSSAKPSSSSGAKPSSSSSSSAAKPSSSSSSAAKPSSSSSSSGSSSSSSSTPKPASPQSMPTISANAWMSFFLFCCLVLIILQGPLGLTGGGSLPGVAQWGQWPNWGGGWWTGTGGWGVMGGAPGCVGFVAGVVPWCHPQPPIQPQPQPILRITQPQVIHQYSPPIARYLPQPQPQQPRVVSYQQTQGSQMGGQGGFATPEGGAGWSWFANGPSSENTVRQYASQPQGQYYQPQPQQRSVQYQRPGLQLQVSTGPQQQPGKPLFRLSTSLLHARRHLFPSPHILNHLWCLYQLTKKPIHPTTPFHNRSKPKINTHVQSTNHGTALPYTLTLTNTPLISYPLLILNIRIINTTSNNNNNNGLFIDINNHTLNLALTQTQMGIMPIPTMLPTHRHLRLGAPPPPPGPAPAMQPVQPIGPPPVGPTNPYGGLANLENAFYPLLVGAIALLVIFDYAS